MFPKGGGGEELKKGRSRQPQTGLKELLGKKRPGTNWGKGQQAPEIRSGVAIRWANAKRYKQDESLRLSQVKGETEAAVEKMEIRKPAVCNFWGYGNP